MANVVVSVNNLSKTYQLGVIGTGTFFGDLNRWWAKKLGKPDPYAKVVDVKYQNRVGDTIWALDNVSFKLKQGEALGIIGRNGAGKSTLLKILSRVTAPTSGEVKVKGRIASLLEVGTGFHPELTGRENIYLNGAILGMSRAEVNSKFDEIVDFSGVDKFIDTPVKRYSSGMYVRLAFAVAAHLEPEILVVDEVLAVGDAEFQKKCLGKMSDVADSGRTVLFVSHNMPAILRLCSSAILLDKGRLVMQGSPMDVTNYYLSAEQYAEGVINWTEENAPGDDEVKLLEVRMVDTSGNKKPVLDVTEKHYLRIKYLVQKPSLKFRCSMKFNTQGVTAFVTMQSLDLLHEHTGIYESYVEIPPNLLTEGEYTLSMSLFSHIGSKKQYAILKNFFSFQVADYMNSESSRGDYAQSMPGVVRPYLKWGLDYLG
jgi:lipopolysaccharide transport system ATP-binding protein